MLLGGITVKKNDMLTVIGFVGAVILIIYGMTMGDSPLGLFWDPASLFITGGGSLGALLMAYPINEIKRFGKVFVQVLKQDDTSKIDTIKMFVNLSKKARREGLLSLEEEISQIDNDFVKKALNMVVDGIEPDSIREIMTLEIQEMENRHSDAASMFTTWGSYAPAMGMIGTLIGLIQMLANLSDANNLAKGMGVALITTFYGSILANVFLIPVANKLNYKTTQEVGSMEMMIEGVLAIQSGVNPRIIEDKMIAYLSPADRKVYLTSNSEQEV